MAKSFSIPPTFFSDNYSSISSRMPFFLTPIKDYLVFIPESRKTLQRQLLVCNFVNSNHVGDFSIFFLIFFLLLLFFFYSFFSGAAVWSCGFCVLRTAVIKKGPRDPFDLNCIQLSSRSQQMYSNDVIHFTFAVWWRQLSFGWIYIILLLYEILLFDVNCEWSRAMI